jgi:hypothetical protein
MGHRYGLCVGNDVERIEDVAQIDQDSTCDGPETFAEVTDGELFGVGRLVPKPAHATNEYHGSDRDCAETEELLCGEGHEDAEHTARREPRP